MKKIICPSQGNLDIMAEEPVLLLDIVRSYKEVGNLQINIKGNSQVDYFFLADYESESDCQGQREINLGPKIVFNSSRLYLQSAPLSWQSINNFSAAGLIDERVLFYQNKNHSLKIDDHCFLEGLGNKAYLRVDGVLGDEAQSEYLSELVISSKAQNSDTRIDMQLYIFGDKARGTMLPSLKISAHKVKAGHGAGTFTLSDEDLFYLRARGLNEKSIKGLVLEGLLQSFLKRLADDDLKSEILKRAKKYLSANN